MSENKNHKPPLFTAVSAKAWKQQIQYELMGADYNEKMVRKTPGGIKVKPFYTSADLSQPPLFTNKTADAFHITFEIYANQAQMSNKKALWCIEKGCSEIIFLVQESVLEPVELLQGIPEDTSVLIILKQPTEIQINLFTIYLNNKKCLKWNCVIDPLSHFFESGNWWQNEKTDLKWLVLLFKNLENPILYIDARRFQAAGATNEHQLAYALSHLTEYLLLLSDATLLYKIKKVFISLHVGQQYLLEISKLRAFDKLWKSINKTFNLNLEYGLLSQPGLIDKTLFSSNTNLIRNSSALMASVLGGASSLVCTPYDTIFKKSHAYSDRLSINQALIIKHECGLDKLIDPISGSYAVEKLSIEIAEKALAYFKNIEAQGGLILALKNNSIQKNISLQFESQLAQYKSNEKELIGANILPDIETLSLEKFPFIRIEKRKTTIAPLISKRFSMDWEIEAQKSVYENK